MTEKSSKKKKGDPAYMVVRNMRNVSVSDGEGMIAPGDIKKVKFVIGSMLLTCGVCEEVKEYQDEANKGET